MDGSRTTTDQPEIKNMNSATTTATQHTPGPWQYHLGRGQNPRFHVQTETGYHIASTTELVRHSQAHGENAQREANAKLLAAAPELLASVRECVELIEAMQRQLGCNFDEEELANARAAITKATQL